eukprot:6266065-Amphidinium_carterae.1
MVAQHLQRPLEGRGPGVRHHPLRLLHANRDCLHIGAPGLACEVSDDMPVDMVEIDIVPMQLLST